MKLQSTFGEIFPGFFIWSHFITIALEAKQIHDPVI